jgi:general secretion pathway protein D
MIMGGLILETDSRDSKGLPLVSRIPGFGGLFGEQAITKNRTELVLFVTPRVVESEYDVRGVVDEMRRRMERLDATFPATRPGGPPGVPPSPPEFVAPR